MPGDHVGQLPGEILMQDAPSVPMVHSLANDQAARSYSTQQATARVDAHSQLLGIPATASDPILKLLSTSREAHPPINPELKRWGLPQNGNALDVQPTSLQAMSQPTLSQPIPFGPTYHLWLFEPSPEALKRIIVESDITVNQIPNESTSFKELLQEINNLGSERATELTRKRYEALRSNLQRKMVKDILQKQMDSEKDVNAMWSLFALKTKTHRYTREKEQITVTIALYAMLKRDLTVNALGQAMIITVSGLPNPGPKGSPGKSMELLQWDVPGESRKEMRKLGACIACQHPKQKKCSEDYPCVECEKANKNKSNKEKAHIPCVRPAVWDNNVFRIGAQALKTPSKRKLPDPSSLNCWETQLHDIPLDNKVPNGLAQFDILFHKVVNIVYDGFPSFVREAQCFVTHDRRALYCLLQSNFILTHGALIEKDLIGRRADCIRNLQAHAGELVLCDLKEMLSRDKLKSFTDRSNQLICIDLITYLVLVMKAVFELQDSIGANNDTADRILAVILLAQALCYYTHILGSSAFGPGSPFLRTFGSTPDGAFMNDDIWVKLKEARGTAKWGNGEQDAQLDQRNVLTEGDDNSNTDHNTLSSSDCPSRSDNLPSYDSFFNFDDIPLFPLFPQFNFSDDILPFDTNDFSNSDTLFENSQTSFSNSGSERDPTTKSMDEQPNPQKKKQRTDAVISEVDRSVIPATNTDHHSADNSSKELSTSSRKNSAIDKLVKKLEKVLPFRWLGSQEKSKSRKSQGRDERPVFPQPNPDPVMDFSFSANSGPIEAEFPVLNPLYCRDDKVTLIGINYRVDTNGNSHRTICTVEEALLFCRGCREGPFDSNQKKVRHECANPGSKNPLYWFYSIVEAESKIRIEGDGPRSMVPSGRIQLASPSYF